MDYIHQKQLKELEDADEKASVESKSDSEQKLEDVTVELNRLIRVERNLKQILFSIIKNETDVKDVVVEEARRISKLWQYSFHEMDGRNAQDRSWNGKQ
jgi:molybdenum-dependent DNA-binding transcriptional regulator ModE